MSMVPEGAVCALHPLELATGTCARCGNFLCGECTHGETDLCPSCVARSGPAFEFTRNNGQGLWDFVWRIFGKHWLMLALAVMIEFAAGFMVGIPGTIIQFATMGITGSNGTEFFKDGKISSALVGIFAVRMAFSVLQQIAILILGLGLTQIVNDLLHGKPLKLELLFSQLRKTPTVLFIVVLEFLIIVAAFGLSGVGGFLLYKSSIGMGATLLMLGLVLTFGLGLWVLLPWSFAFIELSLFGGDATEVLGRTMQVADGKRLEMFLYLLACGGIAMCGYFACCIGILPAMGLMELLRTGAYLMLRRGSSVDPTPSMGTHEVSATPG